MSPNFSDDVRIDVLSTFVTLYAGIVMEIVAHTRQYRRKRNQSHGVILPLEILFVAAAADGTKFKSG